MGTPPLHLLCTGILGTVWAAAMHDVAPNIPLMFTEWIKGPALLRAPVSILPDHHLSWSIPWQALGYHLPMNSVSTQLKG